MQKTPPRTGTEQPRRLLSIVCVSKITRVSEDEGGRILQTEALQRDEGEGEERMRPNQYYAELGDVGVWHKTTQALSNWQGAKRKKHTGCVKKLAAQQLWNLHCGDWSNPPTELGLDGARSQRRLARLLRVPKCTLGNCQSAVVSRYDCIALSQGCALMAFGPNA